VDGAPAWWSHRLKAMHLEGFTGQVLVSVTRVVNYTALGLTLPTINLDQQTTGGARPFTCAEMVHFIATRYWIFRLDGGGATHGWAKKKVVKMITDVKNGTTVMNRISIGVEAGQRYMEDPLFAAHYDRVMASADKAESALPLQARCDATRAAPPNANNL